MVRATKSRETTPATFDAAAVKQELLRDAKALHLADSTAEIIAGKVVTAVTKWVEKRSAVTTGDIQRRVAIEVERYNADLAYVYQNRGKII